MLLCLDFGIYDKKPRKQPYFAVESYIARDKKLPYKNVYILTLKSKNKTVKEGMPATLNHIAR